MTFPYRQCWMSVKFDNGNIYIYIYIYKASIISLFDNFCDYFYLPDKATRSVESSPTAVNLAVMLLRLSKGLGMEVLAPAWLAALLSLLPNWTSHVGPPACNSQFIVHWCWGKEIPIYYILPYLFIHLHTI